MKLNLKECDNRKFDSGTGEIFCVEDELSKSVEDCLECMHNDNPCDEPKIYTEFQVKQIMDNYHNRIKKIEKQRDINCILCVLVLLCWMLFEIYSKIG